MTVTSSGRKSPPKQLTFGSILYQGCDPQLETEEVENMFAALVSRAKAVLAYTRNAHEQPRASDKMDSLRRAAELAETLCAAAIALRESLEDEESKAGVA